MSGFVWFTHHSAKTKETLAFYETLLGWPSGEGPGGMPVFQAEEQPFAGVAPEGPGGPGWLPFVAVADVDAATKKATALGGQVVQPRTRGPAGHFTVVRDPGGGTFALWQQA